MRPDMHDRCDSISLLRYVPPETTDDPLFFSFSSARPGGWGAHEAVECVCVVCLVFVVSSAVVALENYVKASHTLMFGTFGMPLETASTSHRHHVLRNQHEAYLSMLTGPPTSGRILSLLPWGNDGPLCPSLTSPRWVGHRFSYCLQHDIQMLLVLMGL